MLGARAGEVRVVRVHPGRGGAGPPPLPPPAPGAGKGRPGPEKGGPPPGTPARAPQAAAAGTPSAGGAAEKIGLPEEEAREPAPATLVVALPAEARLTINRTGSRSAGGTRT